MGQRLGIAAALLGDPSVLILDEPVNGLDTDGIRWIRDLLRGLAGEGRTVFVSSQLMSEMELHPCAAHGAHSCAPPLSASQAADTRATGRRAVRSASWRTPQRVSAERDQLWKWLKGANPDARHDTVRTWEGRTMVDHDGDRIGTIDAIYLDDHTSQPEWALLNTGLFGTKQTSPLAPWAHTAHYTNSHPRAPAKSRSAPNVRTCLPRNPPPSLDQRGRVAPTHDLGAVGRMGRIATLPRPWQPPHRQTSRGAAIRP
jgi:hypothetical protein